MGVEVTYDSQSQLPQTNMYDMSIEYLRKNGKRAVICLIILIIYLGVLVYLGKNNGPIEIIMWTLFILIVLGNVWVLNKPPPPMKTIFKPDFNKNVANVDVMVSEKPPPPKPRPNSLFSKIQLNVPNRKGRRGNKQNKQNKQNQQEEEDRIMKQLKTQVYHIPNNKYNYIDSQAICKAYGGRLANYDELEKAYEDGANWCSYGWSKDQMALFPTQKETWKKLQKESGHENDCGRPGINGGFIKNPNVRFGVNCFGPKPAMRPEDEKYMQMVSLPPESEEDILVDKREQYWSKRINDILVAPFNSDSWSE